MRDMRDRPVKRKLAVTLFLNITEINWCELYEIHKNITKSAYYIDN